MMYYEINVAQQTPSALGAPGYQHFFATHERSCVSERDARRVYQEIKARFPAPEFDVTVTCWELRGKGVRFK